MADEQFHEFHLDGKQMVFLFMATTVVAVVIFLCGVMVGRGVRASQVNPVIGLAAAPNEDAPGTESTDPLAVDPGEAVPPVADDGLEYSDRLTRELPAPERIRENPPRSARREAVASSVPEEPVPVPRPETREKPETPKVDSRAPAGGNAPGDGFAEPSGSGYSVQVSSLAKETDAKAIGRTLRARKYPVFITQTPSLPKFYRVRVGKYQTEKEARAVLARLEKTEGFRGAWLVPR